jgi:hypothetical protein
MRYTPSRRVVVLAVLFLLLIAPWASAAPGHESSQPPGISGIPDLLSVAWSWITGGWMKEGRMIDPDGRCVTPVPTKEGCNIDANGRCLPTSVPVTPSGNSMSGASGAHGRAQRPALPAKIGSTIEPDGRYIP